QRFGKDAAIEQQAAALIRDDDREIFAGQRVAELVQVRRDPHDLRNGGRLDDRIDLRPLRQMGYWGSAQIVGAKRRETRVVGVELLGGVANHRPLRRERSSYLQVA